MKTTELLERNFDTEEVIEEIRERYKDIGRLEIFADNYAEIIETDESERGELLDNIEALYNAAKILMRNTK